MNIWGIIAVLMFLLYCSGAIALMKLRMGRNRKSKPPFKYPEISILKPLKGIDDKLEENLLSFFKLDYPHYELIFGAESEKDIACQIAKKLMARYPQIPSIIVTGSSYNGANPKVRILMEMMKYAKGDLIVISDSNVRVAPDYLKNSICYFENPSTALLSHILSGIGEKTIGSIFEHMHICGYIAVAQAFATVYARITPVIGKSMIIRRTHLEEIGGIGIFADFLAEDYLLGRKLSNAGKKIMLSPWTVINYNSETSIKGFFMRHMRWLGMRWRINPLSCIVELLSVPILGSLLWFISNPSNFYFPLILYLTYVLTQQLIITMARDGKPLPIKSIFLSPLKDIFHISILIASLIVNKVEWRGKYYKIGWNTKLTPLITTAHKEISEKPVQEDIKSKHDKWEINDKACLAQPNPPPV